MLLHALSVIIHFVYIGNMIKKLLALESVHGPAVLDVMDYLESVNIKRFIFHYHIRHALIHELGVVKLEAAIIIVLSSSS